MSEHILAITGALTVLGAILGSITKWAISKMDNGRKRDEQEHQQSLSLMDRFEKQLSESDKKVNALGIKIDILARSVQECETDRAVLRERIIMIEERHLEAVGWRAKYDDLLTRKEALVQTYRALQIQRIDEIKTHVDKIAECKDLEIKLNALATDRNEKDKLNAT